MKTIKITMQTSGEVKAAIQSIGTHSEIVNNNISRVIARATKAVASEAIRRAPAGPTGNLKRGITYTIKPNYGEVLSKAPHSHYVEFGTGERVVYPDPKKGPKHAMRMPDGRFVKGDIYNGKMTAHPFMRPALESQRSKIETDIVKAVNGYDTD